MSVVYVALTATWMGEMLRLRRHVMPVHFLCLACVFVKALESILISIYYHRQVRQKQNHEHRRHRSFDQHRTVSNTTHLLQTFRGDLCLLGLALFCFL